MDTFIYGSIRFQGNNKVYCRLLLREYFHIMKSMKTIILASSFLLNGAEDILPSIFG